MGNRLPLLKDAGSFRIPSDEAVSISMIARQDTLSDSSFLTAISVPAAPLEASDFAQWVLGVRFTDHAAEEMFRLQEKNQQGTISQDERAQLDKYLAMAQLVDLFQASARMGAGQTGAGGSARNEQRRAFDAFRQIVEITADVFQQQPKIKPDYDPEFPGDKYVVLIVETPLDRNSILEKEAEWTHRVASVEPKWDAFRLSIRSVK
jgi:hypothetical protein